VVLVNITKKVVYELWNPPQALIVNFVQRRLIKHWVQPLRESEIIGPTLIERGGVERWRRRPLWTHSPWVWVNIKIAHQRRIVWVFAPRPHCTIWIIALPVALTQVVFEALSRKIYITRFDIVQGQGMAGLVRKSIQDGITSDIAPYEPSCKGARLPSSTVSSEGVSKDPCIFLVG
jgi:hypothetical protein